MLVPTVCGALALLQGLRRAEGHHMQYNRLGSSHLRVSEICLGTVTWGEANVPVFG